MYHLVIAARKDKATGAMVDRYLSDAEWRDIAETYMDRSDAEWRDIAETYMDRIGLARRGDDEGVRWVAVRHADDHVHVVATHARQDGRRVWPKDDFWRAGEASRAVEARYGLAVAPASDRTGVKRATYAEQEKAARRGDAERCGTRCAVRCGPRRRGRRRWGTSWTGCAGTGCWFGSGTVSATRGEITGYAVALPDGLSRAGTPVFFGAGSSPPT